MNEQLYALVRAGRVENVIVADDAFVASIAADWDAIIRVDGRLDRPGPGWTYDPAGDRFIPPAPEGGG